MLRETLDRVLGELGWTATMASDGRQGAEKAIRGRYAAILLDYKLPDIDGLEVLSRLQAAEVQAPVIVITGEGDEEVALAFLGQGAVDYVTKTNLTPARLDQALDRALWVTEGTGSRPAEETQPQDEEPSRRVLYYTPDEELEELLLDGLARTSWPGRPVRLAGIGAVGPTARGGALDAVVADVRGTADPTAVLERVLEATDAPVLVVVETRSSIEIPIAEADRTNWIAHGEISTLRLLETLKQAVRGAEEPVS